MRLTMLRNVLLTYLALALHQAARAVMLVRPFLKTQRGGESPNRIPWPYPSVAPALTGGRGGRIPPQGQDQEGFNNRGSSRSSNATGFLQKPDHNFWPYVPVKAPAWPGNASYYDVPRHNFWPFVPVAPPSPRRDGTPVTVKPGLPRPVTPPPVPVPTLPGPTRDYDYGEVVYKSILFYEAQRSGWLPDNRKVQWRGHSALEDQGENGEDLTGGWYDAGDYVKFGFPMAGATTILLLGLTEFRDAYESLGLLEEMYDCIKWPLDYFMKAHPSQYEFYAQVADPYVDHSYWGRPEDMTMFRPAYKLSPENPGSDVIGETAAALAAGAVAFQRVDKEYSNLLLRHAAELFEFADRYRGVYSDSLPIVQEFYSSSGYTDELAWAAAWLYRATGDKRYLRKAEESYVSTECWAVSWDSKDCLAALLLYKVTGKNKYREDIERTMKAWMPGGSVDYTPAGLAFRTPWGPIRYTANMATLALAAANAGIEPLTYRTWARNQIHYMLGDSGRSFVIGFGDDPPVRPHHAASSCPPYPSECTWFHFTTQLPNPITLYGAVVGGPALDDDFRDARDDYYQNEVTCDYNAGFQSAVAGLIQLELLREKQEMTAGMKQFPGHANNKNRLHSGNVRHRRPSVPNFKNVFPARIRSRNTGKTMGRPSTARNTTESNVTDAQKNLDARNPKRLLNTGLRNKYRGNSYRNASQALGVRVKNIQNMDREAQKKNWGGLFRGFASKRAQQHRTRRQQQQQQQQRQQQGLQERGAPFNTRNTQRSSQRPHPFQNRQQQQQSLIKRGKMPESRIAQRQTQTHHPSQDTQRQQTDQRQQILQSGQKRRPATLKIRSQLSFPTARRNKSRAIRTSPTPRPHPPKRTTRNVAGTSNVNRPRRRSTSRSAHQQNANKNAVGAQQQRKIHAQNQRTMQQFVSARSSQSPRQRKAVKKVASATLRQTPHERNKRTMTNFVSSKQNKARSHKSKERELTRTRPPRNTPDFPKRKIQRTPHQKPSVQNQITMKQFISSKRNKSGQTFIQRQSTRPSPEHQPDFPRQKAQNTLTRAAAGGERKGLGNTARGPFTRADHWNKRSILKYKHRTPRYSQSRHSVVSSRRHGRQTFNRERQRSSHWPSDQHSSSNDQQGNGNDPKRNTSTAVTGQNAPQEPKTERGNFHTREKIRRNVSFRRQQSPFRKPQPVRSSPFRALRSGTGSDFVSQRQGSRGSSVDFRMGQSGQSGLRQIGFER